MRSAGPAGLDGGRRYRAFPAESTLVAGLQPKQTRVAPRRPARSARSARMPRRSPPVPCLAVFPLVVSVDRVGLMPVMGRF